MSKRIVNEWLKTDPNNSKRVSFDYSQQFFSQPFSQEEDTTKLAYSSGLQSETDVDV
jgi:hypothetical protein